MRHHTDLFEVEAPSIAFPTQMRIVVHFSPAFHRAGYMGKIALIRHISETRPPNRYHASEYVLQSTFVCAAQALIAGHERPSTGVGRADRMYISPI